MFNELIMLAQNYCDEIKKLCLIYAIADKTATPGSTYHAELLKRASLEKQSNKVTDIRISLIDMCWDYRLEFKSVITMAKWLKRNNFGKLTMIQWLPLIKLM